jgi:hypothetical protein
MAASTGGSVLTRDEMGGNRRLLSDSTPFKADRRMVMSEPIMTAYPIQAGEFYGIDNIFLFLFERVE